MKLDFGKGYEYVSGRILLKTRLVKMLYPKMIRGYKVTPHKIVRNIDGEWYESRPTKKIWPALVGLHGWLSRYGRQHFI